MNRKVGNGSLRAVEPKSENAPTYKGSVTINDVKYWLSGWKKIGEDGKAWLSLSVETADEPAEIPRPKTYAQRRNSEF